MRTDKHATTIHPKQPSRLLLPVGVIAFGEHCQAKPEPSAEGVNFRENTYPVVNTVEENQNKLQVEYLSQVSHFILPMVVKSAGNYQYLPIENH
ncbi:MAG: hypothetical protein CVU06_15700 [Bacteroidetes bacterium HGW-Bacteroidetes-22]|nr:MAG: hypothetical protein CVU06_15700 [Bacteroidetes bacterium HGW-Bacteroidetes-22]